MTGTFTAPTPSGADGSASVWVGIDGDTCGTAILQTGIDVTVSGGEVSYDGEYLTPSSINSHILTGYFFQLGMSGSPLSPSISPASPSVPVMSSPPP